MNFLNPQAKTKLFGFSMSNLFIYALILVGVFIMIKIGNVFASLFTKIKSFLGFDDTSAKESVQEDVFRQLKKDTNVQTQMNTANGVKANQIDEALQGFGYNSDALYSIFKTITGPNQMKAVYLAFGTRTIRKAYLFTHTGDLVSCIKDRLWSFELNKNLGTDLSKWSIKDKLNWITKI